MNKNTLVCFNVAQPLLENRSLLDGGDGGRKGVGGVCGRFANQVVETTIRQTVSEG